jgi:hypothetical protein
MIIMMMMMMMMLREFFEYRKRDAREIIKLISQLHTMGSQSSLKLLAGWHSYKLNLTSMVYCFF